MTDWLRSHWHYLAPVLLVALASLATALTRYPRAAGVVTALRVALDVLSALVHRDSPGRWQWPLVERSRPPAPLEPPPEPQRPRIELVRPGVGPLVALLLALAAPAHAQMLGPARVDDPPSAPPAVQADMPTPPVDAPQWIPLAVLTLLAAGFGGYLMFRRGGRGFVLVAGLALGASACASWRNDVGGYDPIGAAGRERLAARVDCLGPVVLEASGRVALGALQLVLTGQQTNPAAWRELLAPVVRGLEPRVLACLRAPAVAVRITTNPPSIAVEAAP